MGPDDRGTPIADTLARLDRARPRDGFDTPRVLDDETYSGAFAAWETARADVVDKWNFLADKANLEPRTPPVITRAAEIVRSHAPPSMTQDQSDRAIDTVHAPYPQRTIRTFRAAMKSLQDPAEPTQETILEIICDLGLEPHVPPNPYPRSPQTTSISSAG